MSRSQPSSPLEALVARLTDEVTWLRSQLKEAQMGLVALGSKRALAEVEYAKTLQPAHHTEIPVPKPVSTRKRGEKQVYPSPESSVHYASLMAEGHLEPPVSITEEEEQEIIRREAARQLELAGGTE